MAGRLPFNLPNASGSNPLHDPQIRAALGLNQVDEALFLQQQRELQRDYQLRQLLLQDQFDHQSRIDSLVVEQRLKQLREQFQEFPELQQHYTQLLLQDRLQRDQEESNLFARAHLQQHEELQRRALAQSQTQTQQNSTSVQGHQQHTPHGHNAQKLPAQSQQASQESSPRGPNAHGAAQTILRDIAADSLAGNAVKRSELEKRVFANPDETGAVTAPAKKRPRAGTEDSSDGDRKKKKKKEKQPKKSNQASSALDELGRAASQVPKQPVAKTPPSAAKSLGKHASGKPSVPIKPATLKPSAQALLDFASGEARRPLPKTPIMGPPPPETTARGNLEDLLNAAESSNKTDEAASVLTGIKKNAEWSDDEGEDGSEAERKRAIKRGDNIELPNFVSILPQLPQEPEVLVSTGIPGKTKRKKHKGLLDDDSVEKSAGKTKTEKKEAKEGPGQPKLADPAVVEVTYPVDTWWPNAASIREEKKSNGEPLDEEIYDKDEDVLGSEFPFKANLPRIKERFAQDVKPGVLEKVPHCRIHQLAMRKRKFPPVPELVHCFQVTEIYPNDMMVCCSHCGTWRHTACGGHYKPFSVRECIDSPFTAVCDRCHAEEKILRDYPTAKKRIDRQRSEQIRRGLATSAAMRQASFSKHGGTYKWPLGSVSATHIGGHTRSVHTRHDKAEKQWQDMASRLNRIYGYRPKERVKVRTKELERLLVSVEDAEGHTERHNMMLFLLNDTLKEHPSGFEKRRRNIFDPEEDESSSEVPDSAAALANGFHHSTAANSKEKLDASISGTEAESTIDENSQDNDSCNDAKVDGTLCVRKGCFNKPRFDSVFCSDACGVASLESDLLRTFHYTSDMHPSQLRS